MTPALLAPLGLAALLAVVVPLLIHLRRRTEQVPTDFAALRWLERRPRPKQRIRFDEWPLLATRLILIGLLAVLLAAPVIHGWTDDRPRTLVVPGVDAWALAPGAQWIAPGFPTVEGSAVTQPVALASLIRQFDTELPPGVPLTIVVPDILSGVDAGRLRLSRQVTWRVVPGAKPAPARPDALAPAMAVRFDGDGAAVRYFRAAAAAWVRTGAPRFAASADTELPDVGAALVWLRSGPVPEAVRAWIERGGIALLGSDAALAMPGATAPLWTGADGATIVEGAPLGRGRVMRFIRPLTPAAIPELVEPDFAERLRVLMSPPPAPPARVLARDYAPVAGVAAYPQPPRDLAPYLALLIAAVFAVERWLATARRRGVAA